MLWVHAKILTGTIPLPLLIREFACSRPKSSSRMMKSWCVLIYYGGIYLIDESQKLHNMGIQRVEDPLNCTHLVSNTILRTEKFLCAISRSPFIVTETWVRECLRSKKVVGMYSNSPSCLSCSRTHGRYGPLSSSRQGWREKV